MSAGVWWQGTSAQKESFCPRAQGVTQLRPLDLGHAGGSCRHMYEGGHAPAPPPPPPCGGVGSWG